MQLLCTLRDRCRQRPRNTRYQADANPYLGRTYTGWIAPACGWRTYWITSSAVASSVSGMVRPIDISGGAAKECHRHRPWLAPSRIPRRIV